MTLLREPLAVGASAPVRAVLTADNHLCRFGADEAAADPRLAEHAVGRASRFGLAEASFAELRTLLSAPERDGELLLHAGDLADFASDANFAAARAFWNENARRPVLAAVGNHEFGRGFGVEDETPGRNAALAPRVRAAWPNDPDFAELEHGGVLFVAMDDSLHRVSETQRKAFRRAAGRGLPVVLLLHAPVWEPSLGEVMLRRTGGYALYCLGASDAVVDAFQPAYAAAQRADAPTRAFLEDLQATPNLRAVLAGHVHVFHRADLFPGVPQICTPPGFGGQAVELEFR